MVADPESSAPPNLLVNKTVQNEEKGPRGSIEPSSSSGILFANVDFNQIQVDICSRILEQFHSNAVSLILRDIENPEIIIKKTLAHPPDWLSEESFQLGDSLVLKAIDAEKTFFVEPASNIIHPVIDGPEAFNLQTGIAVPLIVDSHHIGAVLVINPTVTELTKADREWLEWNCNYLAVTVANIRYIQKLRIENANLEAFRWELLQSRNTLRAMFDSIPTSIYIIDSRYHIVAINHSRSNRVNIRPSQIVGQICYEKLYGNTNPCSGCRVSETLLTGKDTTRSDRQWLDADQIYDWEISTYAILDETGTPTQAIIFEKDVTTEKRLEANLMQSEKLAAVGQLAAGVAHEINNPLSAVIANTQLLKRDLKTDDPDVHESLDLIETAGLRASQVVRNLLGFARKEQMEFLPIDLNETIHNALALTRHEIVSNSVDIELDLADELPIYHGSKEHLQGVWINIILNALSSMEKKKGVIRVTSRFAQGEYRISIADNGVGIPADKVSRIFEPFFTTKAPGKGTGLGLSVVHRVIKQHGGYILVDSLVGSGTKFTIVLPINPPPVPLTS
jgi:two-component system NtrC family sensor kinase